MDQENEVEWAKSLDEHVGELFTTQFFRVVLDEAHAIKNPSSRSELLCTYQEGLRRNVLMASPIASRGCMALSSKHRWAVTGTPLINSIDGKNTSQTR